MSGEEKSKTLNERLEEVEVLLEEYERKIGFNVNVRDCTYLNLTDEDLKGLTMETAGEAAASLAFYSIYIQKELNKQMMRVNWCEANLKLVYGAECRNYEFYSYEEKKNCVTRDNEYALKLFNLKVKSQSLVDRLAYIPNKIEFAVRALEQLQRSKSKNYEKFS